MYRRVLLYKSKDRETNPFSDVSNRKAMNRNWSNQKANPALKTKKENKLILQIDKIQLEQIAKKSNKQIHFCRYIMLTKPWN